MFATEKEVAVGDVFAEEEDEDDEDDDDDDEEPKDEEELDTERSALLR
jgi:hypothetical protein